MHVMSKEKKATAEKPHEARTRKAVAVRTLRYGFTTYVMRLRFDTIVLTCIMLNSITNECIRIAITCAT